MRAHYVIKPVLYAAAFAAAFYVTLYDASDGAYNTSSWTEAPQEILLALSGLLLVLAYRSGRVGSALALVLAGFYFTCLAREFNNQLAYYFFKRAWVVPALLFAIPTAVYAFLHRGRVWADVLALKDTFAFGVLAVGLLLLHVFSRLYGANDLWRAIMGDDFMRPVARVSEEGIELMAYTIIFLGSYEMYRRIKKEGLVD